MKKSELARQGIILELMTRGETKPAEIADDLIARSEIAKDGDTLTIEDIPLGKYLDIRFPVYKDRPITRNGDAGDAGGDKGKSADRQPGQLTYASMNKKGAGK